ncbi:phage virion morphogenesis protein [Pseudoalteromonas luteoviolacea]|uniref:phage virion morphogenesis protein n=1 Tax=Pseudoalteromonas luteoviolacea TaxID=43657 RepID=UPI001B362509|nr:phage virion morphogenesis protein [Pseudoalteromonas luteoviolacea]
MLKVHFDEGQSIEQLEFLMLKPQKRRNILRSVIRDVRKSSRKRIQKEQGLSGQSWQARANGKKKKMLVKLKKHMQIRFGPNNAKVYFKGSKTGKIASAHQIGASLNATPTTNTGAQNKSGMATKRQAIALRNAGYKIPRNRGKGSKNPSLKWIQANLTQNQAGFILRELKGSSSKSKWQIDLPARSFLGESKKEFRDHQSFILNKAMQVA